MGYGAYIHIPFCVAKCLYCDFPSYGAAGLPNGVYADYSAALIDEIQATGLLHQSEGIMLDSIFIGGGTPSILPSSFIIEILDCLRDCFRVSEDCEISIEANPGTVDAASLKDYYSVGINRISFGLQSTDNNLLRQLGRIHTYSDFLKSYEAARAIGFSNINIDMMFGLPNQSVESWAKGLTEVVSLTPEHISAYSLIIEPGTPFYSRMINCDKDFILPDECTDRSMYHEAKKILTANGYKHYEISNFAKKESYCHHNLVYWNCMPYLGFGMAAHSYINNVRYSNISGISEYIRSVGNIDNIRKEQVTLDETDCMGEFMFMGMRKTDGICEQEFCLRFGKTVDSVYGAALKKLECYGLITRSDGYIKLTELGIDISNQVFVEFV